MSLSMTKKLSALTGTIIISFLLISLSFIPILSVGNDHLESNIELNFEKPRLFGNFTERGVSLEWNLEFDEGEIEEFKVYRSLTDSFRSLYKELDSEEAFNESLDGYRYLDDEVEDGRTHHYWVTGISEEGQETPFSNEIKVQVEGDAEPTPPRNLEGIAGDEKIQLFWDRPVDHGSSSLENYILYREKEGEDEIKEDKLGNEATSWFEEYLENGVEYSYSLEAKNTVGSSEPSEEITIIPDPDIPEPGEIEDLQLYNDEGSLKLHWSSPEDDENIISYIIYRDEQELEKVSRDQQHYVDENVELGRTYNYSVGAINIEGEENYSSNVSGSISEVERPDSPYNLTLEGKDQEVKLNWKFDGEPETDHMIYRGKNERDIEILSKVSEATEFIDEGLENDMVYFYQVRSVDQDGNLGEPSEIRHTVPSEEEEDELPVLRIIRFLIIIIGIGIISIIAALRWKHPKGPDVSDDEIQR